MRVLGGVSVLLFLTSTPALAQEYANEDRVRQESGNLVLASDGVNDIGSESDAVVIARFVNATGALTEGDEEGVNARVVTIMRFVVQEIVKNDPRIPSYGQLEVKDTIGGGEYTKSKPHKVLKLPETAGQPKAGRTYFLYLTWFEPMNAYVMTAGPAGIFDLSGPTVTALRDTLDLAKKAPKMEKAEVIQALKESAVAARPKSLVP